MSFADIRGQDSAIAFLDGSVRRGRIANAYIFYGPGGIGKALAAVNFAKAINCAAEPERRPCDECLQCRKIVSANHPDLFLLGPDKDGGSVKVEGIRSIIKDAGLRPYEARKKVYVIDGADLMTDEASNALLKTLEEPPSEAVIILLAENLGALLPTIVSRSQVVRFYPLALSDVKDILIRDHKMTPDRAHIASHLSSGRLGEALRYGDEDFFIKRDRVIALLEEGSLFEQEFDKLTRAELRSHLSIALTWYRDMLVLKAAGTGAPELINVDRMDAIRYATLRSGLDTIQGAISRIISTLGYIEQNVNPKLAMAALGTEIGY